MKPRQTRTKYSWSGWTECVSRTLLSDAFEVDFDFVPDGESKGLGVG